MAAEATHTTEASVPETSTYGIFPAELWLKIISHLDYGGSLALQRASRVFRTEVRQILHFTSEDKTAFLVEAEQYRRYSSKSSGPAAQRFACSACCRLLPRSSFADREVRRYRGTWRRRSKGQGDPGARERVCLECALAGNGRFGVRTKIGGRLVVAVTCGSSPAWRPPSKRKACELCGGYHVPRRGDLARQNALRRQGGFTAFLLFGGRSS